jgi:hypothetical protein
MRTLNESLGSAIDDMQEAIQTGFNRKSKTPDIAKQLTGLQIEAKRTRFKLENFVLGGQNSNTILINGPFETDLFSDIPRYFSVPLAEMKPPGKIMFKTVTPNTKLVIYASYTCSKPSK